MNIHKYDNKNFWRDFQNERIMKVEIKNLLQIQLLDLFDRR